MKPNTSRASFAVLSACLSLPAVADPQPAVAFQKTGYLELGYGHHYLSDGNSEWNDQYMRGSVQLTAKDRVFGEASHQDHFDDEGAYLGAGYSRIFNEDWYATVSAGASTGGVFLPRVRTDGFLYKKWLDKKNLVTGVGFTYSKSRLENYDRIFWLNLIYYFDAPWILEVGGNIAESNPGAVQSGRGYMALTYGIYKHHYLTVNYNHGTEGWQAIGGTNTISDFQSYEITATWRQWITDDFGFNLVGNHYHNPNYDRSGFIVGLFVDF